jgi:predicted nucleic acid-binding protein
MMKVVVDSNIVFSALLNKSSNIGDIILNSQNAFTFYGCDYMRIEIAAHKDKIVTLAGYTEATYHELEYLVYKHIDFIAERIVPFEYWQQSALFVRDTDMDDIPFVALSLFLDIKLWTGDKALMNGLIAKGFTNIITTSEMLAIRRDFAA